jgi:hypothetical protein
LTNTTYYWLEKEKMVPPCSFNVRFILGKVMKKVEQDVCTKRDEASYHTHRHPAQHGPDADQSPTE